MEIDLKTGAVEEQLDNGSCVILMKIKTASLKIPFKKLMPAKMVPVIVELSGSIRPKGNEITAESERSCPLYQRILLTLTDGVIIMRHQHAKERRCVRKGCKSFKRDGIKKDRGTLLCGEVLMGMRADRGFNLQIAWSTGYLSPEQTARRIKK